MEDLRSIKEHVHLLVAKARSQGRSWAAVASATGVSPHTARKRWPTVAVASMHEVKLDGLKWADLSRQDRALRATAVELLAEPLDQGALPAQLLEDTRCRAGGEAADGGAGLEPLQLLLAHPFVANA